MNDYLEKVRHSASHVMAQAVVELFPETKLGFGPAIENGFYYDFDCPVTLNEEVFDKIQDKMREIINKDSPFVQREMPREEAIEFFRNRGEKYKVELIVDMIEDKIVTLYQHDNFIDLCKGPHVESTGNIKIIKLLRVAGAYWRGDEKKPMLQRIYATAFNTQEELDEYIAKLEEAEKRDHRKLSKTLDLFSFPERCGPGLILWHPKGAVIRNVIENFWKEEHIKRGYKLVYTPHIGKRELFEASGHYQFYQDYMFTLEFEGMQYALKPMNCPMHILIYKSDLHSYRELPIRYAELGTVYRNEKSGVLHGGMRVRGFTQDDAHIFCSQDQIKGEVTDVIKLVQYFMKCFGFDDVKVDLSMMDKDNPTKYAGDPKRWEVAESTLREILVEQGIPFKECPGEAAFYGPKIDFKLFDSLGRSWQLSTVQFDFNLPDRFDINFVGSDGTNQKIYMIHRAILGAFERFISVLIEYYGGDLPLWLAPEQVRLLPIADRHLPYSGELENILKNAGIRVEMDKRREKLNNKIRDAELDKIPYIFIMGDKEVQSSSVSIRRHKHGDVGSQSIENIIKEIKTNINDKTK
jgi:threonyl-tRNA synthetase